MTSVDNNPAQSEALTDLAPGMMEAIEESLRLELLGPAAAAQYWAVGAHDVYAIEDGTYPGAGGQQQRYRLYRRSAEPAPVLVYIHGGGWVGGSIELNESATRALASQSGHHVLSISYRLAPDYPYPAGLDDCKAAVQWLASGNGPDDLRTESIAIGGASAGANLALSTALSLPDIDFNALLLYYGVYDDDFQSPSYQMYASGFGLTRERMQEYFRLYDPDTKREADFMVTPLHADLGGLPCTMVVAAQCDVLRSESERLFKRLCDAGVDVEFWTEPGVTHGFINRGRLLPSARTSLAMAAKRLAAITDTGIAR